VPDHFDYHCAEHGVVASFDRKQVPRAQPPTECPDCGGELSLEVRHDTTD
jgi:hypothetical protein